MRQNPQVADGLLSQAVEGKVQELPYKTKEGITEVTCDHEAQTHGGSWLRPPPHFLENLTTHTTKSLGFDIHSPWGSDSVLLQS